MGEVSDEEIAAEAKKLKKQVEDQDKQVQKRVSQLDKIDGLSKKALKAAAELDKLMDE